ncbi:YecH family protein [Utexia brackfieldae]|uniref:YecH family metal-binding protein n=1 Tax=Utexia brackfieldae TaxID=3074108 RepID=UPI00370D39C9
MTSIHGHEVLAMMQAQSYADEQSLLAAINAKFGADATFHTCSKSAMNAAQLIAFLKAKGKFKTVAEDHFTVNPDRICHH